MDGLSWFAPRFRLATVGGLGFAAQVVLLRELMSAFAGNEFTVGVVIALWVLFESLGALALTRVPDERARRLVPLLAAISIAVTLAAVPLPVLSRPVLGLLPAESFSIPLGLAVAAAVLVLPAGLHGALFVACSTALPGRADAPGRAFVWEGLGTVLAGAVVSLLLVRLLPDFAIAGLFAGLLAIALAIEPGRRRLFPAATGAATLSLSVLAVLCASSLERRAWSAAWPSQQVEAVENSPYGKVVTMTRDGQRVVLYNGARTMSHPNADPLLAEELIGFGLLAHPNPYRVLLVGQALAGFLGEVLRHPVTSVTAVQIDPELTRAAIAAGGDNVCSQLADPRVQYLHADPVRFLSTGQDRYDCIIQLDASAATLAASRLFSVEFYRLCRQRLEPDGLLVVAGPGEGGQLSVELARVLGVRRRTLAAVFPYVRIVAADFPVFLASDKALPFTADLLASRLHRRTGPAGLLDSGYLVGLLDRFRQDQLRSSLNRAMAGESADVNTALQPRELFTTMLRQNRLASPGFGQWYSRLGRVPARWLLAPFVLLLLVGVALARLGGAGSARGFAVLTSGFAGAAVMTMTALGYQVRFGSAYSGVAGIMTAFMLGSVAGAWYGARPGSRAAFVLAEALLVLCGAVQPVLARAGSAPAFAVVAFLCAAGIGLQFAVASASGHAGVARRTGTVMALDLAGGFVGGLAAALFLLPVYGMILAAAVVGSAKLASLMAQLATPRSN